ncbi:MAG: AgmX/PglI C-terminal domain-containing protein [Deltaproteobacteria bacterium]|nr:AgmX/PglI C-terminal domain-containing protein [Deltaproteobacteria bacterium]
MRHLPLAFALLLTLACQRTPTPAASAALAPLAESVPQVPTPLELPALPSQPAAEPSAVAPLALTTSDGAGLELQSLEVRTVLDGPLALTELKAVFHNPEDRVREGRFELTLPDGAALSRFAMLQGEHWQEGEVVEKARAQRIYEDFLHRRQDPALLQQDAGNRFSARIFPIPAKGDKTLLMAWSDERSDPRLAWRLPLRGLPKLAHFSAKVFVHEPQAAQVGNSLGATLGSIRVVQVEKTAWQPDADLEVSSEIEGKSVASLRSAKMVAARVVVPLQQKTQPSQPDAAVVVVDTSASLALAWPQHLQRTGEVLALLGRMGVPQVAVLACDQSCVTLYHGAASGFGEPELSKLRDRGPLGASDLNVALAAAKAAAQSLVEPGKRAELRVIYVGDGLPTAGESEPAALGRRVAELAGAGVTRLDAVATAPARDLDLLRALTTAGLASDGAVVDAQRNGADLNVIAGPLLAAIKVRVPGSTWTWPAELRAMKPGQTALIYAELSEDQPLRVELSGAVSSTVELVAKPAQAPLLERAWVGARIRGLLNRAADADPDTAAAFRQQATALSLKHRVLCPTTALLILETEYDYQRYGIDRAALSDILTVGADGAAVLQARKVADIPPDIGRWPRPEPALQMRRTGGVATGKGDEEKTKEKSVADDQAMPPPAAAPAEAGDFREEARRNAIAQVFGGDGDEGAVQAAMGARGLGMRGTGAGGGGSIGNSGRVTIGGQASVGKSEESAVHGVEALPDRSMIPAKAPGAKVAQGRGDIAGVCEQNDVAKHLRQRQSALSSCYQEQLKRNPDLRGKVRLRWTIDRSGTAVNVEVEQNTTGSVELGQCLVHKIKAIHFDPPKSGTCTIAWPMVFNTPGGPAEIAAPQAPPPVTDDDKRAWREIQQHSKENPALTGEMAAIAQLIRKNQAKQAVLAALAWRNKAPSEVLPLVALGDALKAAGDPVGAARAYGSLVDLYPDRADLRRFAGNLLAQLPTPGLALDTLSHAAKQRPDHPSGAILLAVELARAGKPGEALTALAATEQARWRQGNFQGVDRVIQDVAGIIAADALAVHPELKPAIEAKLAALHAELPTTPRLRLLLTWETDATDVDLRVFDAAGRQAWYGGPHMTSGGDLYADIRTGYGPECFAADPATAYPYRVVANYYTRGPMGWGAGALQVVRWDGQKMHVETRPYVLMADHAWFDLGSVDKLPMK